MTNFNTQISKEVGKEGNDFWIQFQTNNEEHFRAMQEVARCCIDSERFGEDADFVDGYVKKSVIIDKIVNTPTAPNPHNGVATASAYRNGTATRQLEIIDYIVGIPNVESISEPQKPENEKTGEWVDKFGNKFANHLYVCSVCGGIALYDFYGDELGHIQAKQVLSVGCPHCLAKMNNKPQKEVSINE